MQRGLCWTCGQPLGRFKAFVLGPAQTITRLTAELPSHVDCNEYALQACPFLSNPRRGRADARDLERRRGYSGAPVNPGVFALWVTRSYVIEGPTVVRVGDPIRVTWWTLGGPAMDAEVEAARAVAAEAVERQGGRSRGGRGREGRAGVASADPGYK
jgi:hypothetical protein